MSKTWNSAVTVQATTADETATAGSDYSSVNRRVPIAAGQRSVTVAVPIADDDADESNETFTLTLSNPSSNAELSANPQADATIIDNDETIPSAVRNLTVDCSSVGVDGEVTVTWMVPDVGNPIGYYGSITEPDSHSEPKYNIPAGATEHTFDGAPGWGDYTAEVYAYLSEGEGPSTKVTQTCQPPVPMVALSDDTPLTVEEVSSVQITATLDMAPASTASVRFDASGATNGNGSCPTGADFYVSDTEFTFFTNTTSASVTLYACNDDDTDDETVTLSLTTTGITGLTLGQPTTVRITITDDDSSGTFLR